MKTVKQTPIKAGMMIFPGVKENDRDQLALEIVAELLSGGNGSLDKLSTEGRLMVAGLAPFTLQDAGSNAIIYIPKLIGQKHEEAEELIWDALLDVQEGRFTDRELQSIKTRRAVERKRQLENLDGIASLIVGLECSNSNYDQWLSDLHHLENITREEIIDVATRYFDREHCTLVRSSMGFPKKEAAIKPDWEHLDAQNIGAQSPFAKRIAARPTKPIEAQQIEFGRDVLFTPVARGGVLYSSPNPRNDIFTLTVAYHYGTVDDRDIDIMAQYFNQLGAGNSDLQQYKMDMDCLGATFEVSTSYDYTYFTITGTDSKFDEVMDLVVRKLRHPRHDAQQMKNIIEGMEASKSAAKDDASTWSDALTQYVLLGQQSPYLDHTTIKQAKKLDTDYLIGMLERLYKRDGYITFVGNVSPQRVAERLRNDGLVHEEVTTVPQRMLTPVFANEDRVFYSTNSKFLKSDIRIYIPSRDFSYQADRAAAHMFNEYMGGGMNSIFFQEIREFRSLGYHTYGYFKYDRFNRYKPYFMSYLGTQCDKTADGIDALRNLMLTFPSRPDKFRPAQDYLISTRNANYIGFRDLPSQVRYWREVERLEADPRPAITTEIGSLRMDALEDFHKKYVEGRPTTILINGNDKKFKAKDLKQYGTVKKVKYDDMIKF